MSIKKIIKTALYTTNASDIGQMYIVLGAISLILGATNGFLIREELTFQDLSAVTYYNAVTLHGIFMIFFLVMPFTTGLANYLVPRMIGAHDLYWPKINALSFWVLVPAVILAGISPFFGPVNTGWYMYAPLSVDKAVNSGLGVNLLEIALILSGISSTLTGVNFLMTITKLKKVPYFKMSLFTWTWFSTSILLVVAVPPLTAGLIMDYLERSLNLPFFDASLGGSPVLWQNVFWFFGHPEVYILMLPAMGVVGEVLPRMVRRHIYGYTALALSSMAIAFLSTLGVWMHHMFTAIDNSVAQIVASATTMAIAVPSGVKVFNWTATLYGGRIRYKTPMLFMLAFISLFLVGGITGVVFPQVPLDYAFNGTYFVVGHFHYMVFAILVALLAAMVYYFPYYSGKWYHESIVESGAIMVIVGAFMIATGMIISGVLGMPRRYAEVPSPIYIPFQNMADVGGILMAIGLPMILIDLLYCWIKGKNVDGVDPWGVVPLGLADFYIMPKKLPLSFGKTLDGSSEEEIHIKGLPYYTLGGLTLSLVPIGFTLVFVGQIAIGLLLILTFLGVGVYWVYEQWFKGLPNINVGGTFGLPKTIKFFAMSLPTSSSREVGATAHEGDPNGSPMELGVISMRRTRTAILWIILAEVGIFGSFIGGYLFDASPVTNPLMYNAVPTLRVDWYPLPLIMTVILLSSSIPAHLSYEVFKRGNIKMFEILGMLTAIMGFIFLMGQLYEFTNIIHFLPQTSAFTAFFYTTVSLHGFHVIMGLVLWSFVLLRSRKVIPFEGATAATYYWHFVDAVWVIVFSTFYLHLFI